MNGQKPEPPSYLSEDGVDAWFTVISRLSSEDLGPGTLAQVEAYAAHVAEMQRINGELNKFDPAWAEDPEGLKRYDHLLKLRERESSNVRRLANRLGLDQQSTMKAETAFNKSRNHKQGQRPWEGKSHG